MSIFLLSYIFDFTILTFLGYSFFRIYNNLGGLFFSFFSFSTGVWLVVFMILFGFIDNHYILTKMIQFSYAISTIALISFLFFLKYFGLKNQKILSFPLYIYLGVSATILTLYLGTDYIVDGLYFYEEKQDWYEVEGSLFFLHTIFNVGFIPVAIYLSVQCLKRLRSIDRKRFQFILIGMIMFALLAFIFLLILPIFGIWALERYVGFFPLPLIVAVFYSMRRYDFLNFKVIFGQIGAFLYALVCTFLIIDIVSGYIYSSSGLFKSYWSIGNRYGLIETFFIIIVFLGIYTLVSCKLLPYLSKNIIVEKLDDMKKHIPFIQNIPDLNLYISKQFSSFFSIQYCLLQDTTNDSYIPIEKYFQENLDKNIFMNDISFIYENRKRIPFDIGDRTVIESTYMTFPLRGREKNILGLFHVGPKPFYDPFLTTEVQALKSFSEFLTAHLKYISIYSQIHDLNVNLDKKVDEKTIEFNNLINRQKEFIAYISHEIRNPLTNAMFLSDGIIQSLENSEVTPQKQSLRLQEDISLLSGELIKIGGLTNKIFSTEKYDLEKVKLFKEYTNISDFVSEEIGIFNRKYPHVVFESTLQIGDNYEIDRVQIRQVLHNLLENAIKFADIKKPQVFICFLNQHDSTKILSVEDNGNGFDDIDISRVFDKYSTGESSSIGLGMGLYLCKRIVELHGWSIEAKRGEKGGGANFTILVK